MAMGGEGGKEGRRGRKRKKKGRGRLVGSPASLRDFHEEGPPRARSCSLRLHKILRSAPLGTTLTREREQERERENERSGTSITI